jgi:hypothetical protein
MQQSKQTVSAGVMLFAIFGFCQTALCLQAPYLISATATSDGSVSLAWRNNDLSTTGYIIQRKDSTETAYKFVDSLKSVATLMYTDSKKLLPTTLYIYQVIAYSASAVSDTSNSAQVTTPVNPRTAPNLTSATALGRRSIRLAWQDSNKMTWGFSILRKDSTETAFHFIDSARSATILTFGDTTGLRPGTLYTYQVIAFYGTTDVNDTSNSMQVTTMPDTFRIPSISASWDHEMSSSIQIGIYDFSNCETGYRIYRDNGSNSGFTLVATIVSANPDTMGAITWNDNTVSLNTWYNYKVAVYKSDSSILSGPISAYTFRSVPVNTKVVFQKIADFPISLSGLSAKAGDSIIFKETSSPAGKYSVANVTDPANPKFVGYNDSSALLSYPLQTLIPAFLRFGVYNSVSRTRAIQCGNKMLVSSGNSVTMFLIQNGNLVSVDSIVLSSEMTMRQMLLLNDSVLAVTADSSYSSSAKFGLMGSWSTSGTSRVLYSARLSNSGFSSFPSYLIPTRNESYSYSDPTISGTNSNSTGYSYIHGCYNENILISIKQSISSNGYSGTHTTASQDSSASAVAIYDGIGAVDSWTNPGNGWPNASTTNTGYYLSPTENLCSAGSELFAADIRDLPDGYHTAVANSAVYRDSTSLMPQNILLDTLNKMVYLFYSTKLTILTYQRQAVGIANGANKLSASRGLSIIPNASRPGVTIVLPSDGRNADLFIYDLSGRVVDRMRNITSNAVFWRPKNKSMDFYVALVRSGNQQYVSKFMVR